MSTLNLENTVIGDEERRQRLAAAYRIILSAAKRRRGEQKNPNTIQQAPLSSPSVTGGKSSDLREIRN